MSFGERVLDIIRFIWTAYHNFSQTDPWNFRPDSKLQNHSTKYEFGKKIEFRLLVLKGSCKKKQITKESRYEIS